MNNGPHIILMKYSDHKFTLVVTYDAEKKWPILTKWDEHSKGEWKKHPNGVSYTSILEIPFDSYLNIVGSSLSSLGFTWNVEESKNCDEDYTAFNFYIQDQDQRKK